MGSVVANGSLVLLFVLIGGYFAASEIALVSLREGQVRRLAERGGRGRAVARLRANPSRFLSAVQIGVTFAGFFAAGYGGATLAVQVEPVLAGWGLAEGPAAAVALVLVTLAVSYCSLVLGELVPKRLAMQHPEPVALVAAPVLDLVARLFRPVIALLTVSTNAVVRVLGIDPHAPAGGISEAELRELVGTHADLTAEERRVLSDAFTATDRVLREVMVPRTEVDFLVGAMPVPEAAGHTATRPHSRYPVIGSSPDDVLGVVRTRDVLSAALGHGGGPGPGGTVAELTREVLRLPGSVPLVAALARMRRDGRFAVVVDEYGGTDGIVTLSDLVEELIGEIAVEPDRGVRRSRHLPDGSVEMDGLLHRDDVKELIGIELPGGHFTTLAGFVVDRLGRTPRRGDSVRALRHRFTVVELDGRRAARIRATPDATDAADGGADAGRVTD